jgi:DNA-binding MarR family transcriptional regulator
MNKMQAPELHALPWDNPRFRNWIAVAKAAQAVGRALSDALAPRDLKTAQLDMMMNIYRHPGMSQQELAEKLIVGRSNITMLMPGMIKKGHIKRSADKQDKRILRLTLTEEGTALLMQALAIYSALIDKAMATATREECDRVGAQMLKMIELLKTVTADNQ